MLRKMIYTAIHKISQKFEINHKMKVSKIKLMIQLLKIQKLMLKKAKIFLYKTSYQKQNFKKSYNQKLKNNYHMILYNIQTILSLRDITKSIILVARLAKSMQLLIKIIRNSREHLQSYLLKYIDKLFIFTTFLKMITILFFDLFKKNPQGSLKILNMKKFF